jgi:septum site-determining protein MinC
MRSSWPFAERLQPNPAARQTLASPTSMPSAGQARALGGVYCSVNQGGTKVRDMPDERLPMKEKSAGRKRARAQGSSTDFSAMSRRQLIAFISELQTKIEKVAETTPALTAESSSISITAPAPPALPSRVPCLVIDNSVRSGQVIDYPDGDVTVVGSVGSGAEIVAGGSIHVYGALRGRALAGTAGDPSARIFCRRFQPELVAINGSYRLADNFEAELADLRDRPVQARLEGTRMRIMPLD